MADKNMTSQAHSPYNFVNYQYLYLVFHKLKSEGLTEERRQISIITNNDLESFLEANYYLVSTNQLVHQLVIVFF